MQTYCILDCASYFLSDSMGCETWWCWEGNDDLGLHWMMDRLGWSAAGLVCYILILNCSDWEMWKQKSCCWHLCCSVTSYVVGDQARCLAAKSCTTVKHGHVWVSSWQVGQHFQMGFGRNWLPGYNKAWRCCTIVLCLIIFRFVGWLACDQEKALLSGKQI